LSVQIVLASRSDRSDVFPNMHHTRAVGELL
jgi:hypothetical protein